ncbi:MAG: putative CRISPR-associated protein [Candidatus Jordarchaeales archaeon]
MVVTVGASLLSNYCRDVGVRQEVLLSNEKSTVDALVGYLKGEKDEQWLHRACAETNTLERILEYGDTLVLLHSETVEGKVCAEALKRFYEDRGYNVSVKEVKGLKYDERKFSTTGLNSLINMLVEVFEEGRRLEGGVVLAATGGFKAETAYATIAALLYGVDVYYIHERFNEIVSLPAIPLFFNPDVWIKHLDDIKWLIESPRPYDEVKNRFGEDLKYFWALLERVERDLCMLSPAGWLVYRAFSSGDVKKIALILGRDAVKAGEHGNLWKVKAAKILPLRDIPDEGARKLLRRILSVGGVKDIRLGRFKLGKATETYIKHQETRESLVRYILYSRGYGYQELEVITESPTAAKILEEFIGSKAYP